MRLGKAFTLKLTAKQGKGIFGDIFNFIKSKPLLKSAANAAIRGSKKYAHKGVDYLSRKAHEKIENFPVIGDGLRRPIRRRGKGIAGMALSGGGELANLIGGPGSQEASVVLKTLGGISNALGLGMKQHRTRTRKAATAAQLRALAKGRAIRDANRAKKMGSGSRKKYYHAGALLPAGY